MEWTGSDSASTALVAAARKPHPLSPGKRCQGKPVQLARREIIAPSKIWGRLRTQRVVTSGSGLTFSSHTGDVKVLV